MGEKDFNRSKKFGGNKKKSFDNSKKTYTREYKREQISKNIQKKKILKKNYEKLLKSEGYEVDNDNNKSNDENKREPRLSYKEQKLKNIEKLKEQKRERRAKKKEAAASKFKSSKEFRDEQLGRIDEIKLKNKQRKERQDKLNVKTRKGQPVMSFKIDDLLNKIKNQE